MTLTVVVSIFLASSLACRPTEPKAQDRPPPVPKADGRPPLTQTVLPEVSKENLDNYKNILFVDQTLEELVTTRDKEAPADEFNKAYELIRGGKPEEAKRSLRKILADPAEEIRGKLWAWKALRDLGERPAAEVSREAHGVVLEVPVDGWTDTLAAYSDGRVRYINGQGKGKLLVWEAPEEELIAPLARELISAASPLVKTTPAVERHLPPKDGVFRVSVLTYGGIHVAEVGAAEVERTPVLAEVFVAGTRLFLTLLAEDEKARQKR